MWSYLKYQFKVPTFSTASIYGRKSNYFSQESIVEKYEFEELQFYQKNCIRGFENDEFIEVFRSENQIVVAIVAIFPSCGSANVTDFIAINDRVMLELTTHSNSIKSVIGAQK